MSLLPIIRKLVFPIILNQKIVPKDYEKNGKILENQRLLDQNPTYEVGFWLLAGFVDEIHLGAGLQSDMKIGNRPMEFDI